jgi:Domain of unknown function (DUF4349)
VLQVMRRHRNLLVAVVAVLGVLVAGVVIVLARQNGGPGVGSVATPAIAPALPRQKGPESAIGDAGSRAGSRVEPAPAQGVPLGTLERSLVRTAQLTLEVIDPAASLRHIRTAAAGVGGVVTQEQTSETGSWVVLRVPADALDRLIDDLAATGRVLARSAHTLDATEEVVDLDARVATQQASVARVRGLLAEAESIGDVVAIESELARREAELDSLTRRLEALRSQVAMSTLAVELKGPGAAPDRPTPSGFLDGLATGWAGLLAVGSAAATAVGFLVPFLPVLAVLVGIGWLARRIVRARRASAASGVGGRSGPGSEGES